MKNVPDDELLSAYLDGEVTPQERAKVEKLLASDPAMRALLDEFRALGEGMRNLPAARLAEDLSDRVLQLAERQILLQRPEAGHPHELPKPTGVTRSIARRFLQPRAIVWTAIILLVAAGLYWFEPRERARPFRQVASGPPVARERAPAEGPALRAAPREKQPSGQSFARQEEPRVESAMPAASPAAAGGSTSKNDASREVKPALGEGQKFPLPHTHAGKDVVAEDRHLAPENRPAFSFGGRKAAGQPSSGPSGRIVKDEDSASYAQRAAQPGPGPVSRPAGGEVLQGANSYRASPYQDVKVITVSVTAQAQEQNALERLLVQQQITFAPKLPGSQQYTGDALPEQLASLLKALRSRKAEFPSVVERSQAANSFLPGGTIDNRPADEPIRVEKDLLDARQQQPQNAQPVMPQQSSTQLRDFQAAAARAAPEVSRVRFILQVTQASPSASSPPPAASSQSKPATRSNPLRRAAGPSSSSDRPQ